MEARVSIEGWKPKRSCVSFMGQPRNHSQLLAPIGRIAHEFGQSAAFLLKFRL